MISLAHKQARDRASWEAEEEKAAIVSDATEQDSDMNIEPVATANAPVNPESMPPPQLGRAAPKRENWPPQRRSSVSTTAPQDDYDEDGMNLAYNEEEDLPSAYEMRRYETEGPLPNFEAVSMPRSTGFEQTRSKAKSRGNGIKVIESGGISSDTTSSSTDGRRRGLLALPLPTKVYGPGPRSLLCLVAGGGVRRGPPLRECSHLVLGDQMLDLQHRVIKPAWRASGNRDPLPMTSAAVAEQVRALRMEAAPGIRVLVGLRSLDVENSYLRLWASRSGLASTANLAYEWLRRTGLDGIALTNLVVGRHTVDIYVQFLKVSALVQRSEVSCVAVYNVEMDDATGVCETETPYSRLSAVATALRGATLKKSTITTAAPTRRTKLVTTSPTPPSPMMAAASRRRKVLKRVSKAVRRRHWLQGVRRQQRAADTLRSSSARVQIVGGS
ncbi:hypothetical protein V5799_032209 [Amblyomma americanum]|uniref:Uncharacterized protein n=1 Tax=Amblyomma americanum TaxID=6943 RepID=A0AAQ4DRU1_AMBAM